MIYYVPMLFLDFPTKFTINSVFPTMCSYYFFCEFPTKSNIKIFFCVFPTMFTYYFFVIFRLSQTQFFL